MSDDWDPIHDMGDASQMFGVFQRNQNNQQNRAQAELTKQQVEETKKLRKAQNESVALQKEMLAQEKEKHTLAREQIEKAESEKRQTFEFRRVLAYADRLADSLAKKLDL